MPKKKKSKVSKNSSNQISNKFLILGVATLIIFGLLKVLSTQTDILGEKTYLAKGGEDNSGSGSSKEDEEDNQENKNEDNDSDDSDNNAESKSNDDLSENENEEENEIENEVEIEKEVPKFKSTFNVNKDQNETETEIELSDGEKIKTKTKDGITKIDITSGGIKTKFIYAENGIIIKAEQEDGTEVELEDESLDEIENRLSKDDLMISTASANNYLLREGKAGALSNFPISVDLSTNTLFIETPNGIKKLTILPEQAIENLIAANIIDRISGQSIKNQLNSQDLSTVDEVITIKQNYNSTVYKIDGISEEKLLGFIPVEIEKSIELSTETGEVLNDNSNLINTIKDILSN